MTEKRRLRAGGIALIFSGVAVVTTVGVVMFASNRSGDPAPAPESALAATPAAPSPGPDPAVSVQSASPQTPTPPDPGAADAPGAIAFANTDLEFSADLPTDASNGPIIAKLRKETEEFLARAKADAQAGQADARANGAPAHPWEYKISWEVLGRSGEYVSLVGSLYQFTGGAHGLGSTDTRIANIKTGEETTFRDMLRYGRTPSPAVVIATCEALKKEKMARIETATVFDEPIICAGPNANVRLEDAKIALAPSTIDGKFGGIYIYFDPYAVGAYAEGAYALSVSHEVFSEDLKASYKGLFDGAPVPPDES